MFEDTSKRGVATKITINSYVGVGDSINFDTTLSSKYFPCKVYIMD